MENKYHYINTINIMDQILQLLNENCLSYNGKEITIIFDDKNNPWFKGKDVVEILGYKNTRQAIMKHVYEEDITSYFNLKGSLCDRLPLNVQKHTRFINWTLCSNIWF